LQAHVTHLATKVQMLIDAIAEDLNGKSILVTGGTGLIGRQIVRLLCDAGAVVKIVSLDKIIVDERAEHILGDLTEFSLCKEITSGMDYVFHIAGIKGSVDLPKAKPASFFVPLLMMNTNVLEASRINGVKKAVFSSSIGAYASAEVFKESEGEDREPMDLSPGWAKRMGELQVKAYRTQYGLDNFAVVRPCNVYGPGDTFDPVTAMVIPSLMYRIHHGEDPLMVWGDGSAIRDFAYSEDVAIGTIQALYYGTDSGFVNLGSGKGYSVRELVETMHSFIPFKYEFDTSKSGGYPKRVMDITLARKMINYDPGTSLVDGLKKTWDWFQENPEQHTEKKNYLNE
jgi:GDP-L-fucose synthase